MTERFCAILAVGGRSNSLGRSAEVVDLVLADQHRLDELYRCLFDADAWLRMRAADALEKVCRQRPEWVLPYVDAFAAELHRSSQPSIQWHLAQIYRRLDLTDDQRRRAIDWLESLVATCDVDWIVAANAMKTLVQFAAAGFVPVETVTSLLRVQQGHASKAVVRRATKLIDGLSLERIGADPREQELARRVAAEMDEMDDNEPWPTVGVDPQGSVRADPGEEST